MKIAMKWPKSEMAASPRSLMILTSWPAVSWPSSSDAAMISTANSDDAVEHLVADRLLEDVGGDAQVPYERITSGDPRRAALVVDRRSGRPAPAAKRSTLAGLVDLPHEQSSSVSRSGLIDTSRPPAATELAPATCIGSSAGAISTA